MRTIACSKRLVNVRGVMTPVQESADRESIYDRTADYVSATMGRPVDIAAIAAIADQEKHIKEVETTLSEEVASNTALTQQVHNLTRQIHDFLTAGTP
jgi:hypothetical protein